MELSTNMYNNVSEVKKSINLLSEDVRSLKNSLNQMHKRQEQRCATLENKNHRLVEEVQELQHRVYDGEQH